MTGETGAEVLTIEGQLFEALRGLVENRVYWNVFPQRGNLPPVWPGIRLSRVNTEPNQTLCGSGDDDTADITFQLDIVGVNWKAANDLKKAAVVALQALPELLWENGFTTYDFETKTHRWVLDYSYHPSSGAGQTSEST